MDLAHSETKINLMRAFAGESMARNRYTFAAAIAREQKMHVIDAVFTYTANQEKEHAEIFYGFLKEFNGETNSFDGGFPVNTTTDVLSLLRAAEHNEYEEFDDVYKEFSQVAKDEGFTKISATFDLIAKIERTHSERFKTLAELLENGKLFSSDTEESWICLNCGHIHSGKNAPQMCPVCEHEKGFFIRVNASPFSV